MFTRPKTATHDVDASRFVHLDGRPGTELTCLDGCLWITPDGSAADVGPAAGQRLAVTRSARLIVCGFGPGRLRVTPPPSATAGSTPWRAWRARVAPAHRAAGRSAIVAV